MYISKPYVCIEPTDVITVTDHGPVNVGNRRAVQPGFSIDSDHPEKFRELAMALSAAADLLEDRQKAEAAAKEEAANG